MIDGVSIFVPEAKVPIAGPDTKRVLFKGLDIKDVNTYAGKYKGLEVKQTIGGIIIHGSLNKYLHGNNLVDFTSSDYKEALNKLETALGLTFQNAHFSYLEFGDTFIMDHPISSYIDSLARYERNSRYEDVTYIDTDIILPEKEYYLENISNGCTTGKRFQTRTQDTTFCVYDKTKEMVQNKKEKHIPQKFRNQNVIKLEIRFKTKKLKAMFGRNLRPYDLFEESNFRKLEEEYCNFYRKIKKYRHLVFMGIKEKIATVKTYKLLTAIFAQLMPKEYDSVLGTLKNSGNISATYYNQINKTIKTLERYFEQNEDLINELDEKINSKQRFL